MNVIYITSSCRVAHLKKKKKTLVEVLVMLNERQLLCSVDG